MDKFYKIKNHLAFSLLVACAIGLILVLNFLPKTSFTKGAAEYPSNTGSTWNIQKDFLGFNTKNDPSKLQDGYNPQGQNTQVNDLDRLSIRKQGYDLFPATDTATTTIGAIKSMHTFRKRSSENILMRSWGTVLEYYEAGATRWEVLKSGLVSGQKFGFSDININTELKSYVYFGNAQDNFSRWNGGHSALTQAVVSGTTSTVYLSDTSSFTATGTPSVILCGNVIQYKPASSTATYLVATSTINFDCENGRGIAQAIDEYSTFYKGNIYLFADNRLWISGNTSTPEIVVFSKYGDAQTYLTTSLVGSGTDDAAGIFNLGEGGGGVTAMLMDENAVYIFKKSIIYNVSLTDSLYTITPLKPFDGKSQTTGAINSLSTFAGGNGIFFITPDNQILLLARVAQIDYPQLVPISENIEQTVDSLVFASSTGIVFKNFAYIAAKSSSDSLQNDVVLIYDIKNQVWESPVIGWNVGDWAIYNSSGSDDLYFGDNLNPNIWQIAEGIQDYNYSFTANWRSKQFDFGMPSIQKQIDSFYVEGYMSQNTVLTISLLLNDNGFTQKYTTTLNGTDTQYFYSAPDFNLFGLTPFGTSRFGTNDDQSGLKKFRVYINKSMVATPFYNAQVEFASDAESQNWEITQFGLKWRKFSQEENPSLYHLAN